MDDVRDYLRLPAKGEPTGTNVRVGMVDTGIDQNHPDLAPALDLATSVDMSESRYGLRDINSHGSHIAGIIAGRGYASDGVYRGIAPDATLVAIKLSDHGGWLERH